MEIRFQDELNSWTKIGLLNPYDLTKEEGLSLPSKYGTRAVVLTEEDKLILVNVTSDNFYTLVGGQIEENENMEESLLRECKEESGYDVSVIHELGYIELWHKNYKRFIFGFIVKAVGQPDDLKLTEKEKELGHKVSSYLMDEAMELLSNDKDNSDNLASVRSLMFLEEAKKYIKM